MNVSYQGRPQDLRGGGGKKYFFRIGTLHVAQRHAAHGEAMRFGRGIRGYALRENFFKWCNLVRFGVYLDQILSLKNYHFYVKNLKIHVEIHINYSYTHMLGISGHMLAALRKLLLWVIFLPEKFKKTCSS